MRMTYIMNFISFFLLLLNFITKVHASALPFHHQTVHNYLTTRCHNPLSPTSAIWSWEGRLVDPSNGDIIANVEGIELVRTLSDIESTNNLSGVNDEDRKTGLWKMARGLRRLDNLKVKDMLTADKNGWDYAGTVLSRKLFCYSPVGSSGMLNEFKLHPNAPTRQIELDEAIALYDTATTFISRDGGREMEVVTEWPDGRWVQSSASAGLIKGDGTQVDYSNNGINVKGRQSSIPFEFTVYAKNSGRSQILSLPSKRRDEPDGIQRSKFIQFGRDEDSENRRFGARETYSYTIKGQSEIGMFTRLRSLGRETISNLGERVGIWDFAFDNDNKSRKNDNLCTCQYTRYGEAPPWYGPGRMCTLELWGRRVDSVTDAPPLAATLAATKVPGFMSVHTPISFEKNMKQKSKKKGLDQKVIAAAMAEDRAAINAVKWFRSIEGSLPLELLADGDANKKGFVAKNINRGLTFADRIRSATTISSAAEENKQQ
mmetsp:Transcript_10065/g.11164  ORF Transcript_10065/g.11164 Transcript_10065/m.11164 type:complete len:487 (+) Transcript_10065:220-1680(+)